MSKTKIEWTEHSWNPVTGCTKISPGCENCYAEHMARRLAGRAGYPKAPHHFDVVMHSDRLGQPLKRKKPTTYFVPSMGDLFHKNVSYGFILDVFTIIERTPQHTYQILTKRPKRIARLWPHLFGGAFPNVWLGVSVENQANLWRTKDLQECPATVRFVSLEPLLGPIDFSPYQLTNLDWVIVGGESGPGARPMHPDWVRGIRDQCQTVGTPFFFKQHGEWVPNDQRWHDHDNCGFDVKHLPCKDVAMARVGKKAAGRLLDGREWNEMPR